jgi:hypothetical protein
MTNKSADREEKSYKLNFSFKHDRGYMKHTRAKIKFHTSLQAAMTPTKAFPSCVTPNRSFGTYPKRRLPFNGLHGGVSQPTELFLTSAVRTSYPAKAFHTFALHKGAQEMTVSGV